MNGITHYRAAERLLSDASFGNPSLPVDRDGHPLTHDAHHGMIARAQTHATLALAAATAVGGGLRRDAALWDATASGEKAAGES